MIDFNTATNAELKDAIVNCHELLELWLLGLLL